MEYLGPEYLRRKMEKHRYRVLTRYRYYDMKNVVQDFNLVTPPEFRRFNEVLGWCGKAVDSLGDRLVFRKFRQDDFDMNTIFRLNNADILRDSAVHAALVASCGFIYIYPNGDGYPRMQVISGADATGVMDPTTGLLTEGYAVLKRDENGAEVTTAYFLPGSTTFTEGGRSWTVRTASPAPLLVPILYRPDAVRPFGHSRISRACMGIMQSALRTLKRAELSAEFYSFPQKYVLGLDPGVALDKWKATISSFLNITSDENGNKPTMGQFQQASMSPFTEQLRTFASLFSGETGLTLDDLGFPSDNPSSADSIKSSHESLRLAARKAQRNFGSGFLNAGYLGACVRDDFPYKREQVCMTIPVWEPVFEPDAAVLSSMGDGINKINQVIPGYFGRENLEDLTGIPGEE